MSHKYSAVPTTVDGIRFHSKGEAMRYQELRLLEQAGAISGLELQPKFKLEVNGVKIGDYVADFRYTEAGKVVTEDYKGMKTPVYNLKKKLMLALHGVDILEMSR